MKIYLLLISFLIVTNSYGQDRYGLNDNSFEIEQKLNQIQTDLLMDQVLRNEPPKVKQSYVESRGFHEIYRDSESVVFIQDKSISRFSDGTIFFSFLREFSKPQYVDNHTYFSGEGTGTMNCKKSEISISRLVGMDRQYNGVVEFQRGTMKVGTEWTKSIKNYLCR